MMTGKIQLLAGTAMVLGTLFANQAAWAQNSGPVATNAELQDRVSALEAEIQQSEMNSAQAANAPPPPPPSGWWSNTTISGRMYFDATNIQNKSNGAKITTATAASGLTNGNGTNFDVKRLYIGIDHTFNDIFAANITTDTTYDGTTGAGQLYLKKAFLQAKIDPALILRVGATDLPWVPYAEGIYGMRYFENTLTEHAGFATSSDWGVHALGSFLNGIVNYDIAAINGGGYKKIPTGKDTNRFGQFDYEGRISAAYDGFNVAIGGYTGKLGTAYGTPTHHTAQRLDALAGYNADGLRLGVEYFNSNNFSTALVQSSLGDGAHGISSWGSYYFLPQWAVFGRYDSVDPATKTAPTRHSDFYTAGITWTPVKIIDLSLAYKHEGVSHGTLGTTNGTVGGSANGTYNEIGIWGDWQF
jgi:hypothetical protein